MAVPLSALREHALLSSDLNGLALLAPDYHAHITARLARRLNSPTPADLSKFDFSDKSSLEPLIIAATVVCMALISTVVFLRLLVRRFFTGRFFLDDYLVILASFFTLVLCSVVMAATKYGLGKHIWNLDLGNIIAELKTCIQLMFVANVFYAAAIAFTKLSIIASYMHIFAPRGLLKFTLQATALVTIGLGLASVPATIFECIPVSGAWSIADRTAKCYPFVHFLYASTAINVSTDLILCIVPIPLFWRLQLPRRQKLMISSLFFLGGFACIASIVRLAYLHLLRDPIDVTRDLVSSVMWTIAECTIGIVCVSLPPLRSLLAKILPSVFRGSQPSDKRSGRAAGAADAGERSDKNLRAGTIGSNRISDRVRASLSNSGNGNKSNKNNRNRSRSRSRNHPQMTSRSTDIMVLSSLTTRHSLYSLQSVDGDAPAVPEKDQQYKEQLARQLGMAPKKVGVSVHISAGRPQYYPPQHQHQQNQHQNQNQIDDDGHSSTAANSSDGALSRPYSGDVPRRTGRAGIESDMEMGLVRLSTQGR